MDRHAGHEDRRPAHEGIRIRSPGTEEGIRFIEVPVEDLPRGLNGRVAGVAVRIGDELPQSEEGVRGVGGAAEERCRKPPALHRAGDEPGNPLEHVLLGKLH
jgi:hypothetical protein